MLLRLAIRTAASVQASVQTETTPYPPKTSKTRRTFPAQRANYHGDPKHLRRNKHPLAQRQFAHPGLQLFKRPHLDLANTFAADAVMV